MIAMISIVMLVGIVRRAIAIDFAGAPPWAGAERDPRGGFCASSLLR